MSPREKYYNGLTCSSNKNVVKSSSTSSLMRNFGSKVIGEVKDTIEDDIKLLETYQVSWPNVE
jgi:hypothetical protein